MKMKWFLAILFLPVCLSAQQYVTLPIPTEPNLAINGISPNGADIVGSYYDGVSWHGFLLRRGKLSTISIPASSGPENVTTPAGVNDMGIVVGDYYPSCCRPVEPEYGFVYHSSKAYLSYEVPGPKMTWFKAINNRGDIVGNYQDSGCDGMFCNRRGFLLSNGSLSTIQFPGSDQTLISGINNGGEIIGNYRDTAGNTYNFTLSKGVYRQFNQVPGAGLFGINDSGDVVGRSGSGSFLLSSSGALYIIAFPGSTETYVSGITNRSLTKIGVVGTYYDSSNIAHGFYAVISLHNEKSSIDIEAHEHLSERQD